MRRVCARDGRWCETAWPAGPVGGLKGLEAREGDPEDELVDWARGPVGMPLPLLPPPGPEGGRVGEAVWLPPERE